MRIHVLTAALVLARRNQRPGRWRAKNGETVFGRCAICHTRSKMAAPYSIGPNLVGVGGPQGRQCAGLCLFLGP